MSGLYTQPTYENQAYIVQERAQDINPVTSRFQPGAVFGNTLPSWMAEAQSAGQLSSPEELSGELHMPTERPASPMLNPADAQKQYGIGDLKFDHPVRQDDATAMRDNKIDQMRRQDILSREPGGVGTVAANFGLNLIMDPVSTAAYSALPGFAEARFAKALGTADTLAGRSIARFAAGSATGAGVQGGLDIARLGVAHEAKEDFTPMDALLDVGQGAVLGGITHGAIGAGADVLSGKFGSSLEAQLAHSNYETGDSAMRTAVSQMEGGQPVEVRPYFYNDLQERLNDASTGASRDEKWGKLLAVNEGATPEEIQGRHDSLMTEVTRMAQENTKPGPQESMIENAAGKDSPAIQSTMEQAKAASQAQEPTLDEHTQLAKDVGDSIEGDLRQAQKEERVGEIPELDQINEELQEIKGKSSFYETLASCMTQEIE